MSKRLQNYRKKLASFKSAWGGGNTLGSQYVCKTKGKQGFGGRGASEGCLGSAKARGSGGRLDVGANTGGVQRHGSVTEVSTRQARFGADSLAGAAEEEVNVALAG